MDPNAFDEVARSIASSGSRRGLLRAGIAVLGGLAGLGTANQAGAATKRLPGEICRKHGDCASGVCGPADATGRRRCHCITVADCPGSSDLCNVTTCTAGVCSATPISCDDNNACTVSSCDPARGCTHTPINCDDGDACTLDSCDPATGCIHTQLICDDSNACTRDTCEPDRGCVYTRINCDDGNACTIDTCDATSGCQNTPIDCPSDTCDPVVGCLCTDTAHCPTGRTCIDGGCYLPTPGAVSQICTDACGPSTIVALGGVSYCASLDILESACQNGAACPTGWTCFADIHCVRPC